MERDTGRGLDAAPKRRREVSHMLTHSPRQDDYFTIGGGVTVQVSKIAGARCALTIDAGRSVPIVRGQVRGCC